MEIKGDYIHIPKFKLKWKKGIKMIAHRKVEGAVRSCTFSRTPAGRYYVSILTVKQYQPFEQTGQICGIDLGLKTFLVTSDRDFFKNHKFLDYKAGWNDRQVIPVNRFFPGSKTCHKCGWIKQDLTLKDRVWECGGCHSILDRDLNASINILHEGLKLISSGTGDYTGGEPNKTSSGKHHSVKPEARFSLADG